MEKIVRIGCPSGFWGDSAVGAIQLVERADVDYLMLDYLAEVTMSILAQARAKDEAFGYARDFVTGAMSDTLEAVAAKGVKIVTNAGGVNPASCARALDALCKKRGVKLRIATVEGDDIAPLAPALRAAGVREMYSNEPLPQTLVSANAYLGAGPIAAALGAGADVVITGRCVDSAMALGVLIHEFGWRLDDWDRMAAGSLVGHVLECGAQTTGGLHTDWEAVPDWSDIGYPIAECRADGGFVLTKPDGTGGLVTPATVAEQMLYEIGDPANYLLPDVTADFAGVRLTQAGVDRVAVGGAQGRPPGTQYKASCTYEGGWRAVASLTIIGPDAVRRAERSAEAILARVRTLFARARHADFTATEVSILGAESIYGPHGRARDVREVVMRIAVAHESRDALEIFAKEIAPAGTNYAAGTTGYAGGRAKPQRIVRLFSLLIDKAALAPPVVTLDGEQITAPAPLQGNAPPMAPERPTPLVEPASGPMVEVPLIRLAWGRSGDKGDKANVAIIARAPWIVPVLRRELTAERMKAWFAHLVDGEVERFEAPGIGAFNFVLDRALGGGGMASLRNDAQGKSYAQIALDIPVAVPADRAAALA